MYVCECVRACVYVFECVFVVCRCLSVCDGGAGRRSSRRVVLAVASCEGGRHHVGIVVRWLRLLQSLHRLFLFFLKGMAQRVRCLTHVVVCVCVVLVAPCTAPTDDDDDDDDDDHSYATETDFYETTAVHGFGQLQRREEVRMQRPCVCLRVRKHVVVDLCALSPAACCSDAAVWLTG